MSKPVDAKAVFQDALELPIAERSAFLDRACGGDASLRARVDALLAADDEAGPFLASPTGAAGDATAAREQPGESIGHFKLQQQIGEGGFGIVWMAEQQEPVRRQVALKIVKRGMDTRSVVARFEQERQALAMMDHQNIAKVFDGGETPAGLPYFVMELVRGVPITQFCDQQHLDPRERLSLFVQVCHAVQHAHQKGIIHRDIKPSNVLVTLHDGVPMPNVIDFGIAKAVHRPLTEKTLFTEFQQMIGTPEYMSPEQAELSGLDIDTRADIYALGVLLYELLTGTLPFDLRTLTEKGLLEMLRTIREDEPPKPSTRVSTLGQGGFAVAKVRRTDTQRLGRLLRGDLDWIVMKALEKDRGRRYVSADAFAADVERYLRDEPVEASPPGRGYRLRKYVRRHRVGVAAASLVVTAMVVGLSVAIWGVLEANDQRDHAVIAEAAAIEQTGIATAATARAQADEATARKEAARANTVVEFVDRALSAADPEAAKGRDYRVRDLLVDFESNLGSSLQSEPAVDAAVHRLLGRAYRGLGMFDKAEPHIERAMQIRANLFGAKSLERAEILFDSASLLHDQLRFAEALKLQETVEAVLAELAPAGETRLACLLAISDLHCHLYDPKPGEAAAHRALDLAQQLRPVDHESIAAAREAVGLALKSQGLMAAARTQIEAALAELQQVLPRDHPQVAVCMHNLAAVLQDQHDLVAAEALERGSLNVAVQTRSEHPSTAHSYMRLGLLLVEQSKFDDARSQFLAARHIYQRVYGEQCIDVAQCDNYQADTWQRQQRFREAEPLFRQALSTIKACSPVNARFAFEVQQHLAENLLANARPVDAELQYRECLESWSDLACLNGIQKASCQYPLAYALRVQGRQAEYETVLEQARASMRTESDLDPRSRANLAATVAVMISRYGFSEDAVDLQRQALAACLTFRSEDSLEVAKHRICLGVVLSRAGHYREAVDAYEAAIPVLSTRLGATNPMVLNNKENLAICLESIGEVEEPLRLFVESLQARRQDHGDEGLENVITRHGLAEAQRLAGRLEEAEQSERQVIDELTKLTKSDDSQVMFARLDLASLLRAMRRLPEAEREATEALTIIRSASSGQATPSELLLYAQFVLARVQVERGEYTAAETNAQECRTYFSRMAPNNRPLLVASAMLGSSLAAQGRFAEAEPLLRQSAESFHPTAIYLDERRFVLEQTIQCYDAMQKPDEAAKWRTVLGDMGKEGRK